MENENSPYYMGNRDLLPVVFETEYNGVVITQELPWDVGGEDLVHSLYVALRSYFGSACAIKMMEGYVKGESSEGKYYVPLRFDFRLTVKSNDRVFTIVLNGAESYGYSIMNVFHTACVSLTFQDDSVNNMIGDYLVDCLDQEPINEEYHECKNRFD